jgi:Ion channel
MATGKRGRYGLLLLTLIAAYLVSAVTQSRWGGLIHVAFVAAVTLLAVDRARVVPPRWAPVARWVVLATAVGAGVCAGLSTGGWADAVANGWAGVMLLLTVTIIVNGVVRLDEVTPQALYAALSAYLLLGMMFAALFGMIDDLVQGAFFANGQSANPQTLQYFSFTTLTTLGYGDFTAAGSVGRAVAVLEALSGQIFLATLVARLVSAYGAGRRRPPPPPPDEAGPAGSPPAPQP